MIITNKIYYHFQRMNDPRTIDIYIKWQIGNIKRFNKHTKNFYYLDLKKSASDLMTKYNLSNKIEVDLSEIIQKNKPCEEIQTRIDLELKKISNNNEKNQLIQFFQEIIYEQIRIKYFSDLPSRLNCIWVSEKLTEQQEWGEILKCRKSRGLVLNVNGIIHKTTGNLICTNKNRFIKDAIGNAQKYWSPINVCKNEIEYLFEGEIEIVKEI